MHLSTYYRALIHLFNDMLQVRALRNEILRYNRELKAEEEECACLHAQIEKWENFWEVSGFPRLGTVKEDLLGLSVERVPTCNDDS